LSSRWRTDGALNASSNEERRLSQEREQLAQAYAVQVVLTKMGGGPEAGLALVANVVNRSSQTITQVEARFCLDGKEVLNSLRRIERVPSLSNLPPEMLPPNAESAEGPSYEGRLTPWDAGMRFDSAGLDAER
jgi:hypothetical protein